MDVRWLRQELYTASVLLLMKDAGLIEAYRRELTKETALAALRLPPLLVLLVCNFPIRTSNI